MEDHYGDKWRRALPIVSERLEQDPSYLHSGLSAQEALNRVDTLFKAIDNDYELGGTQSLRDEA